MSTQFGGLPNIEDHPLHRAQSRSRPKVGYAIIAPICMSADACIILIVGLASAIAYHVAVAKTVGNIQSYAELSLLAAAFYLIAAHHFRLYRIQELLRKNRDYQRVLACWALAILCIAVVLFVRKLGDSVSRGSVICFAVAGGAALVWCRGVMKRSLRNAFGNGDIRGRTAVLLGDSEELDLIRRHKLLIDAGVDEVARHYLSRTEASAAEFDDSVNEALQKARAERVEEIILAIPWTDTARLNRVRELIRRSPLPVRLLPDCSVTAIVTADKTWTTSAFLIELQRAPLGRIERLVKRMFDVVMASTALALMAPMMVLTAIAIKIESTGPVIFKQRRRGFYQTDFTIYKFRTMTVEEDGPSIAQATRGDKRVTRLGRFLRATSIDELPQLINVLEGHMSIVGPRPHAVAHDTQYERIIANYAMRHHVKPGITGWAQVHGYRGGTPQASQMADRIECDLWYINNWSIVLDLRILLLTCFEVLRRRNAY